MCNIHNFSVYQALLGLLLLKEDTCTRSNSRFFPLGNSHICILAQCFYSFLSFLAYCFLFYALPSNRGNSAELTAADNHSSHGIISKLNQGSVMEMKDALRGQAVQTFFLASNQNNYIPDYFSSSIVTTTSYKSVASQVASFL